LTIWTDLIGCEVKLHKNKFVTRSIQKTLDPNKETLLLLHGVGGHAEAYSRNIARLGERFNVYAIDFIWHGYSQKEPFSEKWMPIVVEQVLDFMDSLGVEKAYIEGESFGGWVGSTIAINHPERVEKLILNTSAGLQRAIKPGVEKMSVAGLAQRSIDALDNLNRETVRRRLEWLMSSPDRVTEELIDIRYAIYEREDTKTALKQLYLHVFGEGTSADYELTKEDLSKIQVPTLILWSEHNPNTSAEEAKRLLDIIPNSEFYCISDAGHWPQWEKAEEHDRIVMNFLTKTEPSLHRS
jgi:pimeloyl-ACP methyl ester carboxylesterase